MIINKRIERSAPFVALLISLLYLWVINPSLSTNGDNAHYITLARALASGQGFRNINHPGNPPESTLGVGYPLMLTPLTFFSAQDNYIPFKLFSTFATIISLAVMYVLFLKYSHSAMALMVMVIAGTNPLIVSYSQQVMTEAPYLMFSLAAFFCLLKYEQQKTVFNHYLFASLVMLAFAFHIKSIGLVLPISATIYFLVKKNYKKAVLIFSLSAIIALPWLVRNTIVNEESETPGYVAQLLMKDPYTPDLGKVRLRDLGQRFLSHSGFNTILIPHLFSSNLSHPFSLFIGIIIVLGYLKKCKDNFAPMHIYVLLFLAICFLWPWQGKRLILPLIPFLAFYLLSGFEWIITRGFHKEKLLIKARMICLWVIFVTLTTTQLVAVGHNLVSDRYYGAYNLQWYNYLMLATWMQDNTSPGSIVMCLKPYLFHLYSNRKTVVYPYTSNHEDIINTINDLHVNYVVVDAFDWFQTTDLYLKPALAAYPEKFRLVLVTEPPRTFLFLVQEEKENDAPWQWLMVNKT